MTFEVQFTVGVIMAAGGIFILVGIMFVSSTKKRKIRKTYDWRD